MKINTVIIPLSLGHPNNYDGCMARLNTAVHGEVFDSSVIIQTAGFSKKNPFHHMCMVHNIPEENNTSLCEAMRDRLLIEGNVWGKRFLAKICGWGTRSEIRNAFRLIVQRKIATRKEPLRIVIASNKSHLWRIRWYVSLYKPKAWTVKYKTAKHPFGFLNVLREVFALVKHFISDIFHVWQAKSRLSRWNQFRSERRNVIITYFSRTPIFKENDFFD